MEARHWKSPILKSRVHSLYKRNLFKEAIHWKQQINIIKIDYREYTAIRSVRVNTANERSRSGILPSFMSVM